MKDKKIYNLSLTESQCKNLSEFIEFHLLEIVRNDTEIDNLAWIKDMIDIMDKANEAVREVDNG